MLNLKITQFEKGKSSSKPFFFGGGGGYICICSPKLRVIHHPSYPLFVSAALDFYVDFKIKSKTYPFAISCDVKLYM